jgi:pheromone shutdown protein TraB
MLATTPPVLPGSPRGGRRGAGSDASAAHGDGGVTAWGAGDWAAASSPSSERAAVLTLPTAAGGRAHIIGTSHLHEASVAAIRRLVRETQPDTVVAELDAPRANAVTMMHGRPPVDWTLVQAAYPQHGTVFPGVKAALWAATSSAVMGVMQSVLGGHGVYGGDMLAAMEEAGAVRSVVSSIGAPPAATYADGDQEQGQGGLPRGRRRLVLGDRSLFLTLARAAPHITWAEVVENVTTMVISPHVASWRRGLRKLWLVLLRRYAAVADIEAAALALDQTARPDIYSEPLGREIVRFNGLVLEAMRAGRLEPSASHELRGVWAALNAVMLDDPEALVRFDRPVPAALSTERDTVLAAAIRNAPGRTVVAVVGRGHMAGIARQWDAPTLTPGAVADLLTLPRWHYAAVYAPPLVAAAGVAAWFVSRRAWRHPRITAAAGATLGLVGVGVAVVAQAVSAFHAHMAVALAPAH